MTLGQIIARRNWLGWAYSLRLNNGARAYHLRKILDAMAGEVRTFDELRDTCIKATGRERVKEADPEFAEIVERLNEALTAEVAVKPQALVELEDLTHTKASPDDLAALEEFGLLVAPAEPTPEPPKPKKTKRG